MPDRGALIVWALAGALGLAASGCNATCIRDSDCLGKSVCSENRCLLIVGRDAGRAPSSPPDETPADGADASIALPPDAGN